MIKEHISLKFNEKSAIAEHLVKNSCCENNC